jgi:hypothetical protein
MLVDEMKGRTSKERNEQQILLASSDFTFFSLGFLFYIF